MVRQIGPHYQEPSMIVLQERIHRLEDKVAKLADAVEFLMQEIEKRPLPADPLMSKVITEVVPHRV